ncbi:MAG: hypothetical protein UX31_C0038G0013 [Candidatus Nomurabacteria bacterium GW2011_GWA1_46_11]|uniref:Uncharacterized protein n=2 Tax=Patescibacteria group TaxID=1783273 RepID=A0A0G1TVS7_9BACT|nr:MAG: hypothetical protein UX31_C0038G0013 [Candidatus Nomurabacteria bacterium GW2011_GWA1_46_11]KKU85962.1 MAG: hypothetical protein UY16_C0065G0005 [Candidatus Gottesmanbacteria bacterium GW2011_GWA2_47_9]
MFQKRYEGEPQRKRERDAALQQCFDEYYAGNITPETAREIKYQALRALDVQKDGWLAVEAALTLAFAPRPDIEGATVADESAA